MTCENGGAFTLVMFILLVVILCVQTNTNKINATYGYNC